MDWISHGRRISQLKEHLRANPYAGEKEPNSGKVIDLPKVKQESSTGSKAVILKLSSRDINQIVPTQISWIPVPVTRIQIRSRTQESAQLTGLQGDLAAGGPEATLSEHSSGISASRQFLPKGLRCLPTLENIANSTAYSVIPTNAFISYLNS